MAQNLLNFGNYAVFLDAGFLTDAFRLDSSTLDGTDVLTGTTEFFDVTEYVLAVSISRGRSEFRQPIDAGRCTITIDDVNGDFSVVNSASPYWDTTNDRLGFTPTKRVRIERDGEVLFDGSINTYDQQITLEGKSYVTITCVDDLKVLDRVAISRHNPTAQYSGERIEAILDRAEVNLFTGVGERVVATGLAKLGTQPVEAGVKVAEYFARINLVEQGRIFMSRDGVFVFQDRVARELVNNVATFADIGDTGIPYRSFQVIYQ